ncbi:Uncharacterised protein [Mycobacteroides abscessus]|nr:Uncharacterised protein [Mycobacteroides abscessus]CPU63298.1 Uncharacterised protein [Mycobacteroides abscessus]
MSELDRQAVGSLVQLAVRQAASPEGQRHSIRVGGHLRGEQLRDRYGPGGRGGENGSVAEFGQLREFVVDQGVQRRKPPIWIGGHLREEALQPDRQIWHSESGEGLSVTR